MKPIDDDIKIFHPAKKGAAGADLAELALLMDSYRTNGNMEKATALGEKLAESAQYKTFCETRDKCKALQVRNTDLVNQS